MNNKLSFIVSFQILSSSLDILVKILGKDDFFSFKIPERRIKQFTLVGIPSILPLNRANQFN